MLLVMVVIVAPMLKGCTRAKRGRRDIEAIDSEVKLMHAELAKGNEEVSPSDLVEGFARRPYVFY